MATSTIPYFSHQNQSFLLFHPFSIFSLLLLVFFIIIYKWILPDSIPRKNTPPSVPRLPIIGNLHQLGTYPYRNLQTLSRKYGDLILLHLGSKPTIVISSSELASKVLKTHDLIFAGRPKLGVMSRILGKDILLSPYGEYWRKMRSICMMHLLSSEKVRSFRGVREEEIGSMMKKIPGLSMVNLSEMFISLSGGIICRVAFGNKCGGEKGGSDFRMLLEEFIQLLGGFYIGDYVNWLSFVDWMNGVDAKVSKVTRALDEFMERIIEEHSVSRRESCEHGKENHVVERDFVDVLLEAQSDHTTGDFCLNNEAIKALILNMFAGGTGTMYITLEWTMSELLRNPRIMTELQKEVRGIAGDKKTVSEDDLENMKYLKAVIKEVLRLHCPAPLMMPHESTKDVTINGYDIAAGTVVIVNVWAICRDPALWEEPESFNPERFLNSAIDFRGQDFELIPFGSGRRMCPGMAFAIANIELELANLVHQFDWALPNGVSLDMDEVPGIAVRRKTPLLVVPTPRN